MIEADGKKNDGLIKKIITLFPDLPFKYSANKASQWSSTCIHSLEFKPFAYTGNSTLLKIFEIILGINFSGN